MVENGMQHSLSSTAIFLLRLAPALAVPMMANAQTVEFNRDIRPILSDRCYTCHGPSSTTRKSKLRFDSEASAKQDLGGHFAIVPGDSGRSELIRRITAGDQPTRMPPAYSGPALTAAEIDRMKRWIEQGAVWEKHWSFLPPKRSPVPPGQNAIDYFVRTRLEHEGLQPSPEAPKETLLRRVTFDLTGIPPTLAETDAFLADSAPGAYEKVVDRLLSSPRYGERMAIRWLDAARYADTNGYQTDAERFMWRWRDWVINAFNRNMPFSQFTVEQLAGDMLPNSSLDQKIASGFNRNHRGNGEGGIVPEEYAVEYVVDRVDTTSTVFLGLTAGCARCHDHKYDPISQREYYQLYAFFNNLPERGNAQKYGNSPPLIKAPTVEQQAQLQRLDLEIADSEKNLARRDAESRRGQRAWEKNIVPGTEWFQERELEAAFPAPVTFDGQAFKDAGDVANFGFLDKFTLAARVLPTAPDGAILTRAKGEPETTGYSVLLSNGRVQANFVLRWLDDAIRVETREPLELNRWHHVAVTYDGSRYAEGVKIYVDGIARDLKINVDNMNQDFRVREPLRIGAGGGPGNRFQGTIEQVRVYKNVLPPSQIAVLAAPEPLDVLAAIDPAKRTAAQSDKLHLAWLDRYAPAPLKEAWQTLQTLKETRDRFSNTLPTVMVMQEMPQPREAFLLQRGAYDHPGEPVKRGVPAVLPPLPAAAEQNRLTFARWVVDPQNPLTARVVVNRFWQMYFGVGIVKTVEDFGSQGEWPSHPELLDWLATEFVRTNWDIKALQKTIVMSATYRQTSKASPELLQRDPENRLLARGSRFRLPAEMVRDQALAVSGLLVEKIGGPSVKPYQPAGLWKELSGGEDYRQDHGEGLYRRSLYTFWKRASPPPMMASFDSPGREACAVRETRTNTPLQALDLMNDVTFMEAARVLAQRMIEQGGTSPATRISFAFRLATTRLPHEREAAILRNSFQYNLDRFQSNPEAAARLIAQGESPRDPSADPAELAAYTTVASMILNLDETVTRQ
jgi:hypothetical protein